MAPRIHPKPAPAPTPKPAAPPPPPAPKPAARPWASATSSFQGAPPAANGWAKFNGGALGDAWRTLSSAAAQAASVLLADPGARAEHPIDRKALSPTDKAVINALGLDNLAPGGSVTVEVEATAGIAAVAGVEVGATVSVSVARDKDDPNQFTITVGGSGSVDGALTADTASNKLNGSAGTTLEGQVELTVDLSKPGAATELAAFAVHTGVLAQLSTSPISLPLAGAALALEALPGVSVPGEPLDYVAKHLSAIEVGANGHVAEELAAVLGAGTTLAAEQYLKGGGRIDFNDDGTVTLTASAGAGANGSLSATVGQGATASVQLAGGSAEVTFSQSVTLKPTVPPTVVSTGATAELSLAVTAGDKHGEATVTLDLSSVPPAAMAPLLKALAAGDTQAAARILQNDILPKYALSGTVELAAGHELSGTLDLNAMAGGTGGDAALTGTVTTTAPVASASVQVTAGGLSVQGDALGLEGGATLTWQELAEFAATG